MQRVTLVCRPYCNMSLESLGSLAHSFTDQYLRENFRRIVTGRKDVMSVIEGEPAAQMSQGSTPSAPVVCLDAPHTPAYPPSTALGSLEAQPEQHACLIRSFPRR